jgi:UDP-4-amino-4,6-dideoxy-N-acetyl-beta-L-altrosamine transaminase
MIPYSKQFVSANDIKSVVKVLKSDFLTQGKEVPKFENKIKKFVGSKYAIAVSSASAALHLSCLALDLKENDILWTVPNTFVASASCGLHCGAKIDFVDIDENTNNISTHELEKKLKKAKKSRKLPKILIPVHFSGFPYEQDKIFKLSKKYNFKIIEDASHALGSKYKNINVGSCKWSDMTVFSFHPVKPITSGEGGVITTNSKECYEILSKLRTHGITKNLNELKKKINSKWYYEQQLLGFNYRMSDIHASLGASQLKKINVFLKHRNKIANIYDNKLADPLIVLPKKNKNCISTYHLYVIKLKLKKINKSYDYVFKKIQSKGIGINLHYLPIHLHPLFRKIGFKRGDFPSSEEYSSCAISIPIYFGLKNKDQKKIISVIKNALR